MAYALGLLGGSFQPVLDFGNAVTSMYQVIWFLNGLHPERTNESPLHSLQDMAAYIFLLLNAGHGGEWRVGPRCEVS